MTFETTPTRRAAERGYAGPVHRHLAEEETFFVLDGEVRVEVGGEAHSAGAGAVAFLPRQLPQRVRGDQPAGPVPELAHSWGF